LQQIFYDVPMIVLVVVVLSVGMLAAGLLLRRAPAEEPKPEAVGK
jgi:hypothetical protein